MEIEKWRNMSIVTQDFDAMNAWIQNSSHKRFYCWFHANERCEAVRFSNVKFTKSNCANTVITLTFGCGRVEAACHTSRLSAYQDCLNLFRIPVRPWSMNSSFEFNTCPNESSWAMRTRKYEVMLSVRSLLHTMAHIVHIVFMYKYRSRALRH